MQGMYLASMFAPLLGAILSRAGLRGMGWGLKSRGRWRYLAAAWFGPGVLSILGAGLYFAIFQAHLDASVAPLTATMPPEAIEQLEAQGITLQMVLAMLTLSSFLQLPAINALAAIGEEAGWRGILYPQLKARFGRVKGWLLGGLIWGVWHWPIMFLTGYQYGVEYPGFPFIGPIVLCAFTIAFGIFVDYLYEKTGSIWVPAIAHGALNAAATLPLAVFASGNGAYQILGPAPNGLIAGLPVFMVAGFLVWKARRTR